MSVRELEKDHVINFMTFLAEKGKKTEENFDSLNNKSLHKGVLGSNLTVLESDKFILTHYADEL